MQRISIFRIDRSAAALVAGCLLAAAAPDAARHAVAAHYSVPHVRGSADGPGDMNNAGFESGSIDGGWHQCGDVDAYATREHPHGGAYDEYSGTLNGASEPRGNSGVCRIVAIPPEGVVTARLYQLSNEADTTFAYQEADLLDDRGNVVLNLYRAVNNRPAWVRGRWNLAAYAGRTFWLYFGVHGDGDTHHATEQFVDDVTLTGSDSPPAER